MRRYFSSNYNSVTYPKDSEKHQGLRNAQIGAIHAIASFFTMNSKQAAITVMPTGAGKTAVLMMTPYLLGKNKVLVVTPSVMVRSQITEDFQELSTLCIANVFKPSMKKPIVSYAELLDITEKIGNAFMYNTIPIYWGCENINEIFNENAFINCNGLSNEEIIQKIKEIDENNSLYNDMMHEYPFKNKTINYEEFLFEKICKFIENNI